MGVCCFAYVGDGAAVVWRHNVRHLWGLVGITDSGSQAVVRAASVFSICFVQCTFFPSFAGATKRLVAVVQSAVSLTV